MKKITAAGAVGLLLVSTLAGCSSDASVADQNITKDADNFQVPRRIVFFNGITDKYLLEVSGYCNVNDAEKQLEVICKTPAGYKKNFLGLSDNVTYFVEQLEPADVSVDHYKVVFKPSTIIPNVEIR